MKESKLIPFGYWRPGWEKMRVDWVRIGEDGNETEYQSFVEREEMMNQVEKWPKRAAKIFLVNSEGKVLVVRRSVEEEKETGKWELAGGKIDFGESPKKAIRRETKEEVGLKVNARYWKDLINEYADKVWWMDLFVAEISEEQIRQIKLSDEHDQFAFVGKEDIEKYDWAFGLFGNLLRDFFSSVG